MAIRILIVDDQSEVRWVLAIMLRSMGYEPIEAKTAEEGLEKAVSEGPQLILMDLGLPGMNGVEAARALKRDIRTAGIPVIAQSAWDQNLWKKVAVEAGMVEYIQKPFRAETLKDAIERCITSHIANTESANAWPYSTSDSSVLYSTGQGHRARRKPIASK